MVYAKYRIEVNKDVDVGKYKYIFSTSGVVKKGIYYYYFDVYNYDKERDIQNMIKKYPEIKAKIIDTIINDR